VFIKWELFSLLIYRRQILLIYLTHGGCIPHIGTIRLEPYALKEHGRIISDVVDFIGDLDSVIQGTPR
jgi:hypothetical protein